MKIILIGFMGSGKSSLAKVLSHSLNLKEIDMDTLVLNKTRAENMHEVFSRGGELLLRETEIAIAREWALKDDVVISTGAGVVLNKIVLDYLRQRGGKVVFLNISFEEAVKRLVNDHSRPLFKCLATAKSLYEARLSLYLNYSDIVIEASKKSLEDISQEIIGNIYGK